MSLVWALAACYAPSAREGAPCGPDDACPAGQSCVAGVCGSAHIADAATLSDSDLIMADAAVDTMLDAPKACGAAIDATLDAACVGTFSSQAHFFDIEAKAEPISITGLDTLTQAAGSRTISLYYKTGTHVGFETTASAWTLLGSTTYSPASAAGCPLPKTAMPITFCVDVPATQRVAFYYVMTAGSGSYETTTATVGGVVAEDTYSRLYVGTITQGGAGPAFTVTPVPGHAWQGTIHYQR